MASYLILTPPGTPDRSEASDRYRDGTRFIRDGFSWKAFVFPSLWMLYHRLWLHAVAAVLLQGFALELMRHSGFSSPVPPYGSAFTSWRDLRDRTLQGSG